eukprot:SAG31_NODE_3927_length_3746_cov_1.701124_2_plen_593_part_00
MAAEVTISIESNVGATSTEEPSPHGSELTQTSSITINDEQIVTALPEEFNAKNWNVTWAPEASDVLWANIHVGRWERNARVVVFNILLAVVFLLIAVELAKYDYENWLQAQVARTVSSAGVQRTKTINVTFPGGKVHTLPLGKLMYGLSQYYAPVMVMTMQNFGILPVLSVITATYEFQRLRSIQERSVLWKNFYLLFINVLILPSLALKTLSGDFYANVINIQRNTAANEESYIHLGQFCEGGSCRCYGASTRHVCNSADHPESYGCELPPSNELPNLPQDGCVRHTNADYSPDYQHFKAAALSKVCRDNPVYCHEVRVQTGGDFDFDSVFGLLGDFVLNLNASFMFCFVLSASLLGTAWQLMNAAFYIVCFIKSRIARCSDKKKKGTDIAFWDIAAGRAEDVKSSMKNEGWPFELGYYYAVGLTIFAIVLCYSVVFPPITLAGLLYFNSKHFVDKYNLLYVYPVDAKSGHVRAGGLLGATVHDMILFTLCFFLLIMCAFFYAKENYTAAHVVFWIMMGSLARLLIFMRTPPPVATDIKFGDENRAVVDGSLILGKRAGTAATVIKEKELLQAYQQPLDPAATSSWMKVIQ